MEGYDEKKFPLGFRFKPKDEELVKYYLLPRLQGRPTVPNDSVVEADVYACHPETLASEHESGEGPEEWYFLSPRSRMYGNGVRPARKTKDGRGRWKASTATKEVPEQVVRSGVTFCKSVLNYYEGDPKMETRTKWIMLEITVPEYEIKLDKPGAKNMLDAYVMCKIYVSPQHKRKGNADDEEEEEGTIPAGSSTQQYIQGTAEPMLSEKQTGKRPMVEQPQRGRAPPARQGSLSIGSTQASCSTSNAAAPTQVYYGVLGQPTGAHYGLQAPPMQRPAGAHNGQAPAKPAAGAYSGQRLVRMPTPTPVMYQPFSDPTDEPFGQMATMTARPPNPANQAAARLPFFPGNPPRRHPGTTDCRPHVSLRYVYDQNYRAVPQPPGNASSSRLRSLGAYLPPHPTQQPFFNGDANRRGGAAIAPPGPPYNGYPYQRSSLTPASDGHSGAANERNGAAPARFNVNAEQYFVDLATISTSLPGACPQPAPARLVGPPAPAAVGVAKVKAETGETSGLNTSDAA